MLTKYLFDKEKESRKKLILGLPQVDTILELDLRHFMLLGWTKGPSSSSPKQRNPPAPQKQTRSQTVAHRLTIGRKFLPSAHISHKGNLNLARGTG